MNRYFILIIAICLYSNSIIKVLAASSAEGITLANNSDNPYKNKPLAGHSLSFYLTGLGERKLNDIDCFYEKDGGPRIQFYCDTEDRFFSLRPEQGNYLFTVNLSLEDGSEITLDQELPITKAYDLSYTCLDKDNDDQQITLDLKKLTKCSAKFTILREEFNNSILIVEKDRNSNKLTNPFTIKKPIKKSLNGVDSLVVPFYLGAAEKFKKDWVTTDSVNTNAFAYMGILLRNIRPIGFKESFISQDSLREEIYLTTGFYLFKGQDDNFEPGNDF